MKRTFGKAVIVSVSVAAFTSVVAVVLGYVDVRYDVIDKLASAGLSARVDKHRTHTVARTIDAVYHGNSATLYLDDGRTLFVPWPMQREQHDVIAYCQEPDVTVILVFNWKRAEGYLRRRRASASKALFHVPVFPRQVVEEITFHPIFWRNKGEEPKDSQGPPDPVEDVPHAQADPAVGGEGEAEADE
ncbi:MAG: hypothetical protein ACYTKD_20800 [Planctomycetota bacterium]|jgi:hypothetical protein